MKLTPDEIIFMKGVGLMILVFIVVKFITNLKTRK